MAHNHSHNLDELLSEHGLRKTTFRKEILRIFQKYDGKAIPSVTIEEELDEFDRITLYRTLKSFEEKGLIHQTIDVSGNARYALCGHDCSTEQHEDTHAHFHCTSCGETQCLNEFSTGITNLVPEGYVTKDVQVTLSGLCNTCA